MSEDPLVSIVTVVYNNVNEIEETIKSILNIEYIKKQYVIIDGGSTDGTLDIIEKYKNDINVFISEKDMGIYDAMNKSIQYCNGEWVIFMNSGDKFFDSNILNIIFENKKFENKFVLYGATSYFKNKKLNIKRPESISNIWKGMPICHQSMLIRTSYLRKNLFNLKYIYASDYNLLYDIFLFDKISIENINTPISIIRTKGFSETNSINTYKEYMDISLNKNINNNYIIYIYFKYKIKERKFIIFIKKYLS